MKNNIPIANVSKTIIETMFKVQSGETVAITGDSGSDPNIVNALAVATTIAGGKPLVMWTPKAKLDGQAGMKDWPAEALTAALCNVDVWIEMQSSVILYSDIWETAMKKNKKLRYLVIADSTLPSLARVFTGFDIHKLENLLTKMLEMVNSSKKVRITCKNGTNVSYDIDPNNLVDFDAGDYSKPKFGTAPGYINLVPKTGSMNGRIVFDLLQHTSGDSVVEFTMENGRISEIKGEKDATNFNIYLSSFNDENMYKISHNMFGLHPNIQKLSGELVEDERIWGGVDFGFGHTSPMDMPPDGQVAKSHFDGVVTNVSIFLDDQQIVDDGTICHPSLLDLADNVLKNSALSKQ